MDGTGMTQKPGGVSATLNRCGSNETAYDLTESALLTVNTAILFPNKFPEDFSILIVAKPKPGNHLRLDTRDKIMTEIFQTILIAFVYRAKSTLFDSTGNPIAAIFTVYSDSGEEELVVSLGDDVTVLYGIPNTENESRTPISFGVDVSDGKWHRLGLSIKGDAITLIADCNFQVTKELRRDLSTPISTSGIIIIGQQLLDDNVYVVSNSFF